MNDAMANPFDCLATEERDGRLEDDFRCRLVVHLLRWPFVFNERVAFGILNHQAGRDADLFHLPPEDEGLACVVMPNGGLKMVTNGLEAYGYKPDPKVIEIFTKYRKTHNEGVFDAYTQDVRRCRSSHVLTGLPDAYGRGRIIGDYRRVALYGVDRLIEVKKAEKLSLDDQWSTDAIIRDREELSEQIRALGELKEMAAKYGFDISGPASTAKEAVQWLYFGYLAAVKEQNGAAMDLAPAVELQTTPDGIVVVPRAVAVKLLGISAYADLQWSKQLSSAIGYSFTKVDNTNFQDPTAFHKGEYASANLLWTPLDNVLVGAELLWGKRTDNDGDTGTDTRLQTTFKWSFSSKNIWDWFE